MKCQHEGVLYTPSPPRSNAHSYDRRQQGSEALQLDGLKKSEASEIFHLSRPTLDPWLQRKAATGD